MPKPLGVILAGGRGLRMAGADKALSKLGGQTLIGRVAERLRPQVTGIMINTNGDPSRFSNLAAPVFEDSLSGHLGPLAGVLTGMEWARAKGVTHIVTAATDTPFFPMDMVARLQEAAHSGARVVMTRSSGRRHPVFALWDVTLEDQLRADIQAGARRIGVWADGQSAVAVDFDCAEGDPFFNINTPEDLQQARMWI